MPLFRCPECNREGVLPLAYCESFILEVPYDPEIKASLARCRDCSSGSAPIDPVKWNLDDLLAFAVAQRNEVIASNNVQGFARSLWRWLRRP